MDPKYLNIELTDFSSGTLPNAKAVVRLVELNGHITCKQQCDGTDVTQRSYKTWCDMHDLSDISGGEAVIIVVACDAVPATTLIDVIRQASDLFKTVNVVTRAGKPFYDAVGALKLMKALDKSEPNLITEGVSPEAVKVSLNGNSVSEKEKLFSNCSHRSQSRSGLETIFAGIEEALRKAIALHPNYPVNNFTRLAILTEEAGEVAKAVNDFNDGKVSAEYLKTELYQTAAMCVRFLNALQNE